MKHMISSIPLSKFGMDDMLVWQYDNSGVIVTEQVSWLARLNTESLQDWFLHFFTLPDSNVSIPDIELCVASYLRQCSSQPGSPALDAVSRRTQWLAPPTGLYKAAHVLTEQPVREVDGLVWIEEDPACLVHLLHLDRSGTGPS
ncbi:hypothetical protein GOBAR_AA30247 [Gossypium barbadense]|uniref:Uncharacterized protein n=1 Tax=Gossypium barbadense TaxID=3634 RepID=A0A2P5WH90_GOSBA|nr:hypothetical protein GOBAR_AA30247 [Gossypium barbadense]